jgi:uncharacterized membrane protein HdeD (DUF308 family)
MSATSRIWTTPHVSGTWLAVRGIAAILFGILALVWPGLTILALALLFGVYALVNGIDMIIDAFRGHRGGAQRTAYAVAGTLGVVAGLVTLLWPHITALALVILVGLWAVVTGIFDIVAAARIPGGWPLILLGLLSIGAGILILFQPRAGAYAIAVVLGIYAIVGGALMLAELWRNRHARPTGHDRTAPAGA